MAKNGNQPRADEFNSLTPAAASRYLGVSRQTIYTWLADGTLKGHRVGAHHRVLLVDLERMKRKRSALR